MQVVNKVTPDPAQVQAFFSAPEDGPFVMVNLLKFKERAEYDDGDRGLTGAQAYGLYGVGVQQCIADAGATSLVAGQVTGLMLGEIEDAWDMVALVEYPSLAAFRAMIESPAYQDVALHRTAGLAGQLNIKIKPLGR